MRERIGIITGWTIIIIAFCVFISNAFPPTPPTSIGTIATQNSDNATITGGNVTGLTTFSAATANVDHIGEKTSSHGVVVDNNITVSGAVTADTMSANVIKTDTSADATLSGTPIIITVYDAASNTPYYFKAYPTKQ
jgi:hypothetical protein